MPRVEFFSAVPARGLDMRKLKAFTARAAREISLQRPVSVVLTGEPGIKKLNRRFFSKNSATDVIAFDIAGPGGAGEFCEIYVCLTEARKAASAFGHSLSRELKFLIAHGLLHLSGMDDSSPSDKKKMLDAGEELVSKLKI